MRKSKPIVGVAVETATAYGREIVLGFMRYANVHRQWVLLEDFQGQLLRPSDWPRCDGFVVAGRAGFIEAFDGKRPALVSCSASVDMNKASAVVCMDDWQVGRVAAKHLLNCRLQNFGYYCLRGRSNALGARRLAGFREGLAEQGQSCQEFLPEKAVHITGPRWSARPHWPGVEHWLHGLPKPVGILATDDMEAHELAAICLHADLAVPDRVAIIGVNNDKLLCESAFPPLSSVETNFQQVGYAAASVLDRLLNRQKLLPGEHLTRLAPAGVAQRVSTDVLAVADSNLADAIRYIREHACDPCSVEDVIRHVPVARRWLERQFLQKLARSPHDEITRVRMEEAMRLLLEPDLSLDDVAEHCGFTTVQSFHRTFRQSTGESPAAWRRVHRHGGP
jgi:LacI family transcriptional regulator